ncbi:hypothetical protein CROQUDRAFT_675011 [Cronartium quercuum f. sp. fusiforme G11]|uniref:Uncharacterized protein n=1 Tax=Cronartium quercuum f. sp. fusiforme G11 TaxID=708437 RepID=A0A9P6T6Q4_9BASI|nr:hypothetical protein CROQUDRAFT_675011 [Cronartium quercuum f. sp. fusiforme G11]
MGKSAKFYKRPTKKEKLGLSSNSVQIRTAIKLSKFNQPEKPAILKHEPPTTLASSSNQVHSLIEDVQEEDEEMEIEGAVKKKRNGLKSKVSKQSKDLSSSTAPKDYVDLYDLPDRRKKGKVSKQLGK